MEATLDLLDAAARVPELYVVMASDGILRSSLEERAMRADLAAGDLVRDAVTGHVVGVGDIEKLASRLRELARQPSLVKTMGRSARAGVAEWGPNQNAQAFTQASLTMKRRNRGR